MNVQEIKIAASGIAEDINNDSEKSGDCYTEVKIECSSGNHSFADHSSVWECTYWNNPSAGTPPQLFRVASSCDGGSGGGAGDPNGGGGGTTIPPGDTSSPPITHSDCVENLDCEDCNLPGDLNNDCQLSSEEVLFPQLNLDRRENSWLHNTATSVQQKLLIQFLLLNSSSQEAKDFAVEAVRAWMAGEEVDFEEQIIYTTHMKECVKDIINVSST